jgi:hypothetical protein
MRSVAFFTSIFLLLLVIVAFAACPCKKQNNSIEINESNLTKIIETTTPGMEVEEVGKKEQIAHCGNEVCEEGENSNSCPQDCPLKIEIKKREGLGVVGKFFLVNTSSIVMAILVAILILVWFFRKRIF